MNVIRLFLFKLKINLFRMVVLLGTMFYVSVVGLLLLFLGLEVVDVYGMKGFCVLGLMLRMKVFVELIE